jgi:frataxin-like iron-binding protein CyaY
MGKVMKAMPKGINLKKKQKQKWLYTPKSGIFHFCHRKMKFLKEK